MTALNILLWVIFPYAMLLCFVVGTITRITRYGAAVTARSSETLEKRALIVGSILFHVGILGEIGGHVLGLVIPKAWMTALGDDPEKFHLTAEFAGGFFGGILLIGIVILTWRRTTNARIRYTTSASDMLVDFALLLTVIFGMLSSFVAEPAARAVNASFDYRDTISVWMRSLFTLHPQIHLLGDISWIFKMHIFLGFLIIGMLPFTRLIHALYIPLQYLIRRFIVYRKHPRFE